MTARKALGGHRDLSGCHEPLCPNQSRIQVSPATPTSGSGLCQDRRGRAGGGISISEEPPARAPERSALPWARLGDASALPVELELSFGAPIPSAAAAMGERRRERRESAIGINRREVPAGALRRPQPRPHPAPRAPRCREGAPAPSARRQRHPVARGGTGAFCWDRGPGPVSLTHREEEQTRQEVPAPPPSRSLWVLSQDALEQQWKDLQPRPAVTPRAGQCACGRGRVRRALTKEGQSFPCGFQGHWLGLRP